MGSVTRRILPAVLVAVPAVAAVMTLPGAVATAVPAAPYAPVQAGESKVTTVPGNKFQPAEVTVSVGSRVTWENTDGGFHTVTGGEGPQQDPASPMNGQIASMGATYSVTFDKPGTYKYFCSPHLSVGMVGTVIVNAGGPATTTASATPPTGASSAPPASASASASVGAPQQGAGAPTNAPDGEGGHEAPGVEGNHTLEMIEAAREEQAGAVSGFRFFAAVATAFLFILGVAVLFSTRPRRAGR